MIWGREGNLEQLVLIQAFIPDLDPALLFFFFFFPSIEKTFPFLMHCTEPHPCVGELECTNRTADAMPPVVDVTILFL